MVAPIWGCVRIVRESRFSDSMSKYLSTSATVLFQSFSKSLDGTESGLGTAGRGEKILVTLGGRQPEGAMLHPDWLPARPASKAPIVRAVNALRFSIGNG